MSGINVLGVILAEGVQQAETWSPPVLQHGDQVFVALEHVLAGSEVGSSTT